MQLQPKPESKRSGAIGITKRDRHQLELLYDIVSRMFDLTVGRPFPRPFSSLVLGSDSPFELVVLLAGRVGCVYIFHLLDVCWLSVGLVEVVRSISLQTFSKPTPLYPFLYP